MHGVCLGGNMKTTWCHKAHRYIRLGITTAILGCLTLFSVTAWNAGAVEINVVAKDGDSAYGTTGTLFLGSNYLGAPLPPLIDDNGFVFFWAQAQEAGSVFRRGIWWGNGDPQFDPVNLVMDGQVLPGYSSPTECELAGQTCKVSYIQNTFYVSPYSEVLVKLSRSDGMDPIFWDSEAWLAGTLNENLTPLITSLEMDDYPAYTFVGLATRDDDYLVGRLFGQAPFGQPNGITDFGESLINQPAPGIPGQTITGITETAHDLNYWPYFSMNESGQLIFVARLSNGEEALYLSSSGAAAPYTLLAQTEQAPPDIDVPGAVLKEVTYNSAFGHIGTAFLNNAGQGAFYGHWDTEGGSVNYRLAVWRVKPDGMVERAVTEKRGLEDPVFETSEGSRTGFGYPHYLRLAPNGDIFFYGTGQQVDVDGYWVYDTERIGIWRVPADGSNIQLILARGTPLPEGGSIYQVDSSSLYGFDESGRLLLEALVYDGAYKQGLYYANDYQTADAIQANLQRIAIVGQTVNVAPEGEPSDERIIDDLDFGSVPFVGATIASARNGRLAFYATFTDDSRAFLVTDLPPPPEPTGNGPANFAASGTSEDPVNTYTGDLFNQYPPDINLNGPMPLFFARYYASSLMASYINGSMGNNWRHSFEWTLKDNETTLYIIDSQGRRIDFNQNGATWELTGKTDIVFQLAEDAGVFTLFDPRDQLLYKFNATGQLTSIEDGKGNVHTLTYNDNNMLTQVANGLGSVLSFTYDGDSHLASVGDGTRTIGFSYTDNNLTTVTDSLGHATTYTYGAGGLMTATTRPAGNTPYAQTFHDDGTVASQTDAGGNTYSFDYIGSETTITDPLGNTREHTHTATGELSGSTDRSGQNIAIGSDETGRRNSITDRFGDNSSMTYHAGSGKPATKTHADGTSSSFSYTARPVGGNTAYDLTGITHADATTESFVYDALGNLTSHTDHSGDASSFTYNGNGQPLTVTNKTGGISTNTYNGDATLATVEDPAGNTTSFGYDALRRLNLMTFEDGSTTSFTCDNANRLLTATDENGHTTTLSYDLNGNLTTIQDALQNENTFAYDGNDRLLSVTDAQGGVSTRTYDQLGRLATTTDANNNVTTFGYDIHNRLTSTTDPLGNVWVSTYDVEGIIASRTDPLNNTMNFVSDEMGRITQVISPLGISTSVTYDPMGRINTATDQLGNVTIYDYDNCGLLSGIDLPGGTIGTSYTRNELGQVTVLTDPNGNFWQRAYDNSGRLTSRTDPLSRTTSVSYDNRNRPQVTTFPAGMGTQTNTYDPAGNLISISCSDGTVFGFTYDANDRLLTANNGGVTPDDITRTYDANGLLASSNGIVIGRDPGGRIISMTLATSKMVSYAYDDNDRIVSFTDWAGGTTSFSYDDAGRLLSILRPNGVTTSNTWDNDSRLIGIAEGTISSINLIRDAKGQITSVERNVPLLPSAKGLADQTKAFDTASQVLGFTYDDLGRLTEDDVRYYDWDLASRLRSYTQDAVTTSFTYNAIGQRLSRTSEGITRDYIWNDSLDLPSVSIVRQNGDDLRYYIYTPSGNLLYSIEAADNTRRFYHYDEMGNTIFVTDDGGAVIGSYAYSPFGRLIYSSGNLDNPFTWQGMHGVMDEGNTIYYVRSRYYDSRTGRFISRDVIGQIDPKSVNPYQYAWNNPMQFVDVNGLNPTFDARKRAKNRARETARDRTRAVTKADTARAEKLIARDFAEREKHPVKMVQDNVIEKAREKLLTLFNRIYAGKKAREVEFVTRYVVDEDGYITEAMVQEYGKPGNWVQVKFNRDTVVYWGQIFSGGSRIGGFYDPAAEPPTPSHLSPDPKSNRESSKDPTNPGKIEL